MFERRVAIGNSRIRNSSFIDLDPRVKLLLGVLVSSIVFLIHSQLADLLLFAGAGIMLMLHRMYRILFRFAVAYVFLAGIAALLAATHIAIFVLIQSFILLLLKFFPIAMFALLLVRTIEVGDFITSLGRLKFPSAITIGLAVTIRFIPSFYEEFGHIRNAMRLRGIESPLRRPLRTLECYLVPLLMRCVKISEELSMAAMTKGMDGSRQRTSLSDIRLTPADWLAVVIGVGFLLMLFLVGGSL